MRRVFTYLLGACLGLVVLFAVVGVRAALSARAELLAAESALAAADLDEGVRHLRLAGRWDAPFNMYAQAALLRLDALAHEAETRGDFPRALSAYRSLHAALAASRSPFRRAVLSLDEVDQTLASLMARDLQHSTGAASADPAQAARYFAGLAVHRPRTGFVLLAFAGLISWVFGFASLLLFGMDREGRVIRRIARPSFLCFSFGWVAFAVGLRLA